MKGIRRTPTGWQVFARVQGVYKSRRFPPETTLTALTDARERLRSEVLYAVPTPHEGGSFRKDCADYLTLVAHMPSFSDRAYRIQKWADAFGERPRATITAKAIKHQLEIWRATGSHTGGPLAPASLNQLRTALMSLYTVLDGKSAANIVRDVHAYDERYSQRVRAESMWTCVRLIRRLRPRGKMRAVLYTLLWTGWPAELLRGVTPSDIDEAQQRVRVGRRKKGKGMAPAWVPVVPRALIGFRRLHARQVWGPHGDKALTFSNSSLHSALARAVRTENHWRHTRQLPLVAAFNPYALRHSFATWAASRIKDDRALKELLRTNSIHRYTEGAVADRLQAARDLLLE